MTDEAAAQLLEVCRKLVEGRPTAPPPVPNGPAYRNWRLFQDARAAIAKAEAA